MKSEKMTEKVVKQTLSPRWRGFNLPNLVHSGYSKHRSFLPQTFEEEDFQLIRDWGFDFVRLPLSYRCLTTQEQPFELTEYGMAKIDAAIELGEKYGIHVNLCFHRAPGFSINDDELEPFGWMDDSPAKDHFCNMWCDFTRRYKGIASKRLSFNFINEPDEKPRIGTNLTRPVYAELMRRVIQEVHAIDPQRHCIFDGWRASTEPMPELADITNTSQSVHCYYPHELTHHKIGGGYFEPIPAWPTHAPENIYWDRNALEMHIRKWINFSVEKSVGVHVGECGCFHFTPHNVMMAWADDLFSLFHEYNIGFALWNLRGPFGILKEQPNPGAKNLKQYGKWLLNVDFLKLLQRY